MKNQIETTMSFRDALFNNRLLEGNMFKKHDPRDNSTIIYKKGHYRWLSNDTEVRLNDMVLDMVGYIVKPQKSAFQEWNSNNPTNDQQYNSRSLGRKEGWLGYAEALQKHGSGMTLSELICLIEKLKET